MRGFKLLGSIATSLLLLPSFLSPSEAFADIRTLNGLSGQNQTFQNDSNITISSANRVHSIGWLGLLPVSRGGTGADSFSAGSLLFSNGTSITQDNSNLFWDDTNKRLGIGISSPASTLDVTGNTKITGNLDVTGTITGNVNVDVSNLVPYTGATSDVNLGLHNLTADALTSTNDAIVNSMTVGRGGRSLLTNTAFGHNVLNSISSSNHNTAIGNSALSSGSFNGEDNTAIGSHALDSTTTGSYNTALGFRALEVNTTGDKNVALGMGALESNTTAGNNIGIGFSSLGSITTDGSNVAIGDSSGSRITTGISNVLIGTNTAFYQSDGNTPLTTANNSVYIGANVQGYDNNDNNSIVIGQAAIGAGANKAVLGNSSLTDVYFGSANGNANTHAKKIYSGSSSVPGCIVMGDTAGGVGYVTLDSGVLTVSSTPPTACQ